MEEKTLTVQELIDQLQKVEDKNLPVYICGVGIISCWYAPLYYGEDTVDIWEEKCRISISAVG